MNNKARRFFIITALSVGISLTFVLLTIGTSETKALTDKSASTSLQTYSPGRVLVKFRRGAVISAQTGSDPGADVAAVDAILHRYGALSAKRMFPVDGSSPMVSISRDDTTPTKESGLGRIYRLSLSADDSDVMAVVAALSTDPTVEWAEPDYLAYPADMMPDDLLFPQQWGLYKIQAPAAWDIDTGSHTIAIAIVDSGVDTSHFDLSGKLWVNPGEIPGNGLDDDNNGYVDDVNGWDFVNGDNDPNDDYGHGTQVMGIASADTNNGAGIAGACWGCRIMPVKVMQVSGVANYSDIAAGVLYAAQKGAKVINISLGGYSDSSTLRNAIEAAANTYDAVIIAGAGNDGVSTPFYPAAYTNVIAVAGTTNIDTRSAFSNYGTWVDISAPAVGITTTLMGGGYGAVDGTSYATPFVSGVAGLVRSQHPDWNEAMVRAQVIHTADSISTQNPGYEQMLGEGRLNAAAAMTEAPHPLLTVISTSVNGDPLGRPAPDNSAATLTVVLRNDWQEAGSVSGILSIADPNVTLMNSTASYGTIPAGGSGMSIPVYSFTVSSGAGYNHPIPFHLALMANSGAYSTTIPFTITTRSSDESFCGTITENTTWTNDKTYIVNCNVGIAPGITLTIQPGTVVRFNGNYSLNVGGTLIADGTEVQPIRFMSNVASTWGRVYFDDSSVDATTEVSGTYLGGNILRWVHIEDAGQGVGCNNATPYINRVILDGGGMNCTVGSESLWLSDSDVTGNVSIGVGRVRNIIIRSGNLSISGDSLVFGSTVGGSITAGSGSVVQNTTADDDITVNGSGTVVDSAANGMINLDSGTVQNSTVTMGGISIGSGAVLTNIVSGVAMSHTLVGGGISAGSGSTVCGNDVEDVSGWGIEASDATIASNRVVGSANGINAVNSQVSKNLVANSIGVGLQVSGGTVISNTLTGNSGNAIVIASGVPVVRNNNLELNYGTYDLVNNTANPISATHNWLGTTDSGVIDGRIYDYFDDFNLGWVTYTPVLTGPVQDAPTYVRAVTLTPESPVGIETVVFDVLFSREMDQGFNPVMAFGATAPYTSFVVSDSSQWYMPDLYRASYDFNALISKGVYTISVDSALGLDGMAIAPNSAYSFTVDYAGAIADTTPPLAPVVVADTCLSSTTSAAASWSATDPDTAITLYRYALGTSPAGIDVINWTNTTNTSVMRNGLSLMQGQRYYFSVKARNEGGLWSESASGGFVAGLPCSKVYLPLVSRNQ